VTILSPLPAPNRASGLVREMLAQVEACRFWLAMPVLVALARLLQEIAETLDRLAEQIRSGAFTPALPRQAPPPAQAPAAEAKAAPTAPRATARSGAAHAPVPRQASGTILHSGHPAAAPTRRATIASVRRPIGRRPRTSAAPAPRVTRRTSSRAVAVPVSKNAEKAGSQNCDHFVTFK
jgi:hypothetical protein